VLQVVGGMNHGGTETWLMNVLRAIDRGRTQMDFLVHTENECSYDAELLGLGGRLVRCTNLVRPLRYLKELKQAMLEHGPYDVVHCHTWLHSGAALRAARQAGVPVRVAHAHTAQRPGSRGSVRRGLYVRLMRRWIERHATHGLAVSGLAAESFFGPTWSADSRWKISHCGIDLRPYAAPVDRLLVREELGIPRPALVLGHVGRLEPVKNHRFLLQVAAAVSQLKAEVRVLIVGEGTERAAILAEAQSLGLADKVHLTGARGDVPRLLRAMDVMVFPSFYEGLPLTLLEAQAARLPCVASAAITREVEMIPALLRWLPLELPPADWAAAVIQLIQDSGSVTAREALSRIEDSDFNIRRTVATLEQLYHQAKPLRSAA